MNCFAVTDKGNIRNVNEDFFIADQENNIYIVADGLGGYKAGEVASKMGAEFIYSKYMDCQMNFDEIGEVYKSANRLILDFAAANQECKGMGTTIALACVKGEKILLSNIGDSRVYGINKNGINRLTTDHSLIEELLLKGVQLKEDEIKQNQNVITSALGVDEEFKYDIYDYDRNDYDYLVVCSDGLTDLVPENEIYEAFLDKDNVLEFKCKFLVRVAKENGGNDNITIIGIEL